MIKKLLAIILLLPAVAYGDILFYDPMENNNYLPAGYSSSIGWQFNIRLFDVTYNAVTYVPSGTQGITARYGNGMFQFNKLVGEDRAEIYLRGTYAPQNLSNLEWGKTYWFGWSVYVPSATYPEPWPSEADGNMSQIFTQFHDATIKYLNGTSCPTPDMGCSGQPYEMYLRHDGEGQYSIRAHTRYNTTECSCVGTESATSEWIPFAFDEWHDFVMQIRTERTSASNGIFKMWLDGVQIVDATGIRIGRLTDKGVAPLFGLYAGDDDDDVDSATIYYDEFRVGDENSSYEEVAPRGGPPDATAPIRTNGSPSGTLATGTTSTTLSLTTNETATCKYDTDGGEAYASMANTFTTTNAQSHSQSLSGLSDGNTYTYYVRCTDGTNANTTDYAISFSVDSSGAQTNLINANTLISYDCTDEEAPQIYDGCTDDVGTCLPEVTGNSFEFIINLGVPYENLSRRFFGDAVGTRVSKTLTLDYSLNGTDWTNFETDTNVYASAWDEDDLTDVVAQFIKVTVESDTGYTQFREMELFGTVYVETPVIPESNAGKLRAVRATNGISFTEAGNGVTVDSSWWSNFYEE